MTVSWTVVDSKDETHGNITSEQEVDDNELVAGPSKSYVFVDVSSENQRKCEVHPTQYNIMPYHVISCHIISVHIILVPYHPCIASYYIISYHNDSCDLDVNVVFLDVHNREKRSISYLHYVTNQSPGFTSPGPERVRENGRYLWRCRFPAGGNGN